MKFSSVFVGVKKLFEFCKKLEDIGCGGNIEGVDVILF